MEYWSSGIIGLRNLGIAVKKFLNLFMKIDFSRAHNTGTDTLFSP
jgi:hypothetical protein